MTKIEKLSLNDTRPHVLLEKINELVDAYNSLEESHQHLLDDFENHMHHARELQFGTETPVIVKSIH
jgi:uncharacterized protein YdcH (DUF465 family)